VFQAGPLRVRAWTPSPPAENARYVRFPRDALWIF